MNDHVGNDHVENDHLGLFGSDDEDRRDSGNVDLAELRAALARTAHAPETPPAPRPSARQSARQRREQLARRRRRRRRHTLIAVGVLVVLVAGIVTGFLVWRKDSNVVPDYAGPGTTEVIVQVRSNDTRSDIANTLVTAGVVQSAQAFLNETNSDATIAGLQPGFYKVRKNSPAREAADALVTKANRVGQVRILPGDRWADVTTGKPGGKVTKGFVSQLTEAACVPLNGTSNCWSADALWQQVETADPADIGVPDWAIKAVQAAPVPRNRLEGLLVPGDYSITPNASPHDVLQDIMQASLAQWNSSRIEDQAKAAGLTTYDALIIGSIIQRESNTADMPKVSRVIQNRIQDQMRLQMDSTVNYVLNRSSIATTGKETLDPSPYNTYAHTGLPPTPISAVGPQAMAATYQPVDGPWLYFVVVDLKTGSSCFSTTLAQHEACRALAVKNGVLEK